MSANPDSDLAWRVLITKVRFYSGYDRERRGAASNVYQTSLLYEDSPFMAPGAAGATSGYTSLSVGVVELPFPNSFYEAARRGECVFVDIHFVHCLYC